MLEHPDPDPQHSVAAVFVSDLHLGTKSSQDRHFVEFLKTYDMKTLYLVGDVIDGWRLKRIGWYWPQGHNDVLQKLLRKARKGTEIVYIPGNHDEFLRNFLGLAFGGVRILDRIVHTGVGGKRFLVLHGDQFDMVVRHAVWLASVGSVLYDVMLVLNRHVNNVRRRLGFPYWSLSAWTKRKVKGAVNFIGRFEEVLVAEARREGVDGIICGHIHHAAIEHYDGIDYLNSGDWVESCTALVEHLDGRFEIVRWLDAKPEAPSLAASERATAFEAAA
ncbi:MAG: UDP-2,3-diacylglucosamine diphosphatase [Alphaproteobacteria bacterium]|nr:UDP-2,3-diacylglucosamine diphosphatase [Alphaproteobacteria bacterium]